MTMFYLLNLHKSSTSLLDPMPPPGFELPIYWDPSQHEIDPQGLWLGLVAAGSIMAELGGDAIVPRDQTFQLANTGNLLRLHPFRDESVTYSLLIWTLLELGTQMAQHYPMPQLVPAFSSRIVTSRGIVGTLQLLRPAEAFSTSADTNLTTATRHRRDAVIATPLEADSGVRPCRENTDLVVRYQFLRRPLIPSQVFTAFLRSNTFFSAHGMQEPGVLMVAYSSSRRTHFAITGVGQGPGVNHLTWGLARIAMRTIWRDLIMRFDYDAGDFVDRPRWEAVSFVLEYRGIRVGQGQLG